MAAAQNVMLSVKEQRAALQAARKAEEHASLVEQRSRQIWKLVSADEQWQLKTNRPNRLPPSLAALSTEPEAGNLALDQGKYAEALEHYEAAAAAHPKLQDSVALLDNRALALLLLNRPQECADLTAQCLALSPQFVPALLHRARALRCLDPHNLKPAAETLQTAQELVATNHTLDILREWLLLRIERSERTLSPTGSPGRDDILGALALKKPIGGERLLAAFKEALIFWHPDNWVTRSDEERSYAARGIVAAWQAYTTLNEYKRQKIWESRVELEQSLRTAPHLRKAWIWETSRVPNPETNALTESLVQQVPTYSVLSLGGAKPKAPPGGTEQVLQAAAAALEKQVDGILKLLPELRTAWTWEPPQLQSEAEFQQLIVQATQWKSEKEAEAGGGPPAPAPVATGPPTEPERAPTPSQRPTRTSKPIPSSVSPDGTPPKAAAAGKIGSPRRAKPAAATAAAAKTTPTRRTVTPTGRTVTPIGRSATPPTRPVGPPGRKGSLGAAPPAAPRGGRYESPGAMRNPSPSTVTRTASSTPTRRNSKGALTAAPSKSAAAATAAAPPSDAVAAAPAPAAPAERAAAAQAEAATAAGSGKEASGVEEGSAQVAMLNDLD